MKIYSSICVALVSTLCSSAFAREVSFSECPTPVQQTILAEGRGEQIDEIDFFFSGGRYEVEIDLTRSRDMTLEIAADGRLIRKTEDINRAQLSKEAKKTVRKLLSSAGTRIDDLHRRTAGSRVTYLVEIEHPGDRDQWYTISKSGKILSRSARR